MFPAAAATSRVLTWLVRDSYYENIYPNPQNCPLVASSFAAAIASPEAALVNAKYAPAFAAISAAVGQVCFVYV